MQSRLWQPGRHADHGGGGQHWGDGVRARVWGDVIHLPLTAYGLFLCSGLAHMDQSVGECDLFQAACNCVRMV